MKVLYPSICLGLLLLSSSLMAQKVLAEVVLEELETDETIYPYLSWGPNRVFPFLQHDPALRLEDGSYFFVWKPDKISSRLLRYSNYDLLLNERWTKEFELERNEEILGLVESTGGDSLFLLTQQPEYFQNRIQVAYRTVDLKTGEMGQYRLLQIVEGRHGETVFLEFSPDRQRFAIFYLDHPSPRRSPSIDYEFIDAQQRAAWHGYRVGRVCFSVWDRSLKQVRLDTLTVPERKHVLMGCLLDDEANFYAYLHQRKNMLVVAQSPADGSDDLQMVYREEVPDLYDFTEGIEGRTPPAIGAEQKIFWPLAKREPTGRDRGIKSYRLVCFDFAQEAVDDQRHAEITSTLLVAVEKQREAYSLRPLRRFDNYQIQEMLPLPDGSVWLVVQQHMETAYPSVPNPQMAQPTPSEGRAEELVMFYFDPEGVIRQALVVPSVQLMREFEDRIGGFYHLRLDTANRVVHLLTREAAGEKYRDPDRLFYRKIYLDTGLITDRQQVYEGERRRQYWLKGFTEWMTPSILMFMHMEGSEGDAHLISVDLDAPPLNDDEARGE